MYISIPNNPLSVDDKQPNRVTQNQSITNRGRILSNTGDMVSLHGLPFEQMRDNWAVFGTSVNSEN